MIRALPPVPDLYGRVSPAVLTELMLAILNRGEPHLNGATKWTA